MVAEPEPNFSDLTFRRSRWVSGASWLVVANAASLAATMLVGVLLARDLGRAGFGVYSTVTVATGFMVILATFRLEMHLATVLNNTNDDRRSYHRVLLASYVLVVPICIGAEIFSWMALHGVVQLALAIDVAEVAVAPLFFRRVVLQVRTQNGRLAFAQISGRVVWVAAVVLMVGIVRTEVIVWVMVARVAAQIAESGLLVKISPLSRSESPPQVNIGIRAIASTLHDSIYLILSGIAGTGFARLDQLILSAIRGTASTGLYAAAVRIGELPGVIAPIIQAVSLPGLVELWRRGEKQQFRSAIGDNLFLMLIPAGLASALLVVFADPVVRLLFGREYLKAAPMLVILVFAEWISLPGSTFTSIALAVDCRSALFIGSLSGFAVTLGLDVWLIPNQQGIGAAWASLIGYATAVVVTGTSGVEVRRASVTTGIPLAKAALAMGVTIAVGFLPISAAPARVVLMIVAYVFTAWVVDRSRWRAIRATLFRYVSRSRHSN